MSEKNSRISQSNWLATIFGFLLLASFAQSAHAAAEVQASNPVSVGSDPATSPAPVAKKLTDSEPAEAAESADLPVLLTDSNDIPPSLLEVTHPQLPDGSVSDSALSNNLFGLVTSEQNGHVLGEPLPDDSYIISAAPTAFTQKISLCSDLDFVAALKAGAGASNEPGFNTIPHDESIALENGCVMFAPSKDTRVLTPKGTVVIEKNSLAIVICDNNHLSVYDINDDHKGSIRLQTGGDTIALAPGRHVTVTHGKIAEFSDINPIQSILYKGVSSHKVGDESKAFVSNFSILSAINALQPLGALMQSDHNEAKKVASKILKTSSILLQIDNNGSAYAFHAKQRSVALKSTMQ